MRVTGAQPGPFRGRTGFLEWGHFNKHFERQTKEERRNEKPLKKEDPLKNAFQMRI